MSHVPIRPASTVCALREAPGPFEVLMVRRAVASEFMGGAYVFPGGGVDEVDHSVLATQAVRYDDPESLPWLAAALRELAEEAGLLITDPPPGAELAATVVDVEGADLYRAVLASGRRFEATGLAYLSRWVTPPGPSRRFDTRFYVMVVPAGSAALADSREVTDARWVTPSDALSFAERGEWDLPFPTKRTLEVLSGFADPAEAVAFARSQEEVPRIAPRIVAAQDGSFEVLLEGDPGYEDAPA